MIKVDLISYNYSYANITTASIIYFRYTRKFEEIEEVEASMTTVLQENINGVRVVKAFMNEKYEIDKFEKAKW